MVVSTLMKWIVIIVFITILIHLANQYTHILHIQIW